MVMAPWLPGQAAGLVEFGSFVTAAAKFDQPGSRAAGQVGSRAWIGWMNQLKSIYYLFIYFGPAQWRRGGVWEAIGSTAIRLELKVGSLWLAVLIKRTWGWTD